MYIQIYPNLSKYFIELHIYSSMFPKKLLDENCSAFFSSGKWEKSTWTLLGGMEWQWNVRAFVGCRKYGWANRRFLQCSFRADGLVSSSTANRTTQPTVFVCKYERAGHGVHSAANFYDFLCKILSIYIYIWCLFENRAAMGAQNLLVNKTTHCSTPKCLRNVHCQSLTFQALSGIGSGWVQVTKEKDINGIFRTPK